MHQLRGFVESRISSWHWLHLFLQLIFNSEIGFVKTKNINAVKTGMLSCHQDYQARTSQPALQCNLLPKYGLGWLENRLKWGSQLNRYRQKLWLKEILTPNNKCWPQWRSNKCSSDCCDGEHDYCEDKTWLDIKIFMNNQIWSKCSNRTIAKTQYLLISNTWTIFEVFWHYFG